MLDVVDDHLVVEEKGIYSVEKFIVARRFMYWQVYLHKTVLSAEYMLVNALRRAKELAGRGEDLWCSPALRYFLYNQVTSAHFKQHPEALHHFTRLDDFDIAAALKVWQDHPDKVLSELSSRIVNRELFKIEVQRTPVSDVAMQEKLNEISARMNLTAEEARYFVIRERVDNIAYNSTNDIIRIRMKDGRVISASEASDHLSLERLSEKVEKWFLAYPRG
jgi:hypothetical protein